MHVLSDYLGRLSAAIRARRCSGQLAPIYTGADAAERQASDLRLPYPATVGVVRGRGSASSEYPSRCRTAPYAQPSRRACDSFGALGARLRRLFVDSAVRCSPPDRAIFGIQAGPSSIDAKMALEDGMAELTLCIVLGCRADNRTSGSRLCVGCLSPP